MYYTRMLEWLAKDPKSFSEKHDLVRIEAIVGVLAKEIYEDLQKMHDKMVWLFIFQFAILFLIGLMWFAYMKF